MRVVFLGNCADYSPGFLATLTERARNPSDPVSLRAVVCPIRFASRPRALWFNAKRRLGRVAARVPMGVAERLSVEREALWQRMDEAAERAGAEMLWPGSMSDPEMCRRIAALEADVAIVAGLDQILKGPVFAAFPPIFNIHPSLLPEFRGATPEFWQLDRGSIEGGVTLHRVEAGIDTGPIVLQKRFAIEPWLDAEGLLSRSVRAGVELMGEFLDGYPAIAGSASPQNGGSSQPKATAQDHRVPFARPATDVFNRARAAGWGSPLVLYVSREDWNGTRVTEGVPAADAATRDSLALQLYDPVPFPSYTKGPPGQLTRVEGGGVALACNPGTVLFRRVEPQPRRGPKVTG